jgi:hypothetical protein
MAPHVHVSRTRSPDTTGKAAAAPLIEVEGVEDGENGH